MRLYDWLLRLYPASFRAQYGDEMRAAFDAEYADSGFFVRTAAAFGDVVPNAIAVQWDVIRQDVRFALRALRRTPAFTFTAIVVLAIGVGANTAAFSLADYVLLRPLPFPRSEQLVRIWETVSPTTVNPSGGYFELSPANYRDWKSSSRSFSGMAAFTGGDVNLVGGQEPLRLRAQLITPELLPVLGASPLFGRNFNETRADDRSIILSYDLWQTQFGSDPGILGRTLILDGKPNVVIGVMPRTFNFPDRGVKLWGSLRFEESDYQDRNNTYLSVVGRLKEGRTVEDARAELALITSRIEREFPKEQKDVKAVVSGMQEEGTRQSRMLLLTLCGAALCILLLTCANLANLLLVRAIGREREIAVRIAIGGARMRLVRQLVTESLVLSVIGGVAGVVVASLGLPAMSRFVPEGLPVDGRPHLDLRVLLFAGSLIVVTGIAFGLIPALRAGSANNMRALRDGTRSTSGRQRLRGALVAVEVAASVVLLTLSGLMIRTLWQLQKVDPGFQVDNVLTLRTALPRPKYDAPEAQRQFFNRVLTDVRALPGVQGAGYVSFLPIAMGGGIWPVGINGDSAIVADDRNSVAMRLATPGYFNAMSIRLVRGRDVAETDVNGNPDVAVVSQAFVNRYWPNEDPIGKTFNLAFRNRTIVGVVNDVRNRGLSRNSEPQVYLPYMQVDSASIVFYTPKDLVVRSTTPPATLVNAIRAIVKRADPDQPISDVRTMRDIIDQRVAPRTAQMRVITVLAAIALLLASVGIHGLLAFTVSTRAREIGVRRALGAPAGEIWSMVVRNGMQLTAYGIVPGIVIAVLTSRAIRTLLFGVEPIDPLTFVAAVGLCCLMALVGSLGPAVRAARVDPIIAMKAD